MGDAQRLTDLPEGCAIAAHLDGPREIESSAGAAKLLPLLLGATHPRRDSLPHQGSFELGQCRDYGEQNAARWSACINRFLQTHKVYPQSLKLIQGGDEMLSTPPKSIKAPHSNHVEFHSLV